MPVLKLKNVSKVKLNGKRPGDQWTVETDADGVVLDAYWRHRLEEEVLSAAKGHPMAVAIVPDPVAAPAPAAPTPPPASAPPATPAPSASEPAPSPSKKA